MNEGCVVLLSGGQDSTTCLLIAISWYGQDFVHPLTFSYDQSHSVEIAQALFISGKLGVEEPPVLHINALRELGGGALTNPDIEVDADATDTGNVYAEEHDLPSTVIPGRNVVMLGLAAAYGAKLGVYHLVTGGCLADRPGYPDCRQEFYTAMETTLQHALDEPNVRIYTPLIDKTKAETFKIAADRGYLDLILEHTHTCYRGDRTTRHDYGYGCGTCPACETRAAGFEEYLSSIGTAA